MKKFFPFLLLAAGIITAIFAFMFIRGRGGSGVEDEGSVPEIPLEMRPFTSLTPSDDGYWLKLIIEDIKVKAASVDYELLYILGDGRTQGVPGSVKLEGENAIERDLLLGSESSGKFRYDEGVERGTLTLRFRNDRGKLVGKLVTDFSLLTDTAELASPDGSFTYTLDDIPEGVFFVVMQTFGIKKGINIDNSWAIFSSDGEDYSGS